uniref:palindromic element RPE4 domain-containing protein n=1 Tax=Candidatus Rickettsia kedanie TaxID=3115352 RepID=UPI00399CFB7E
MDRFHLRHPVASPRGPVFFNCVLDTVVKPRYDTALIYRTKTKHRISRITRRN